MDKFNNYKNFLIELRDLSLFYGIVINGTFKEYEDLQEALYLIDLDNKTIIPTKIAYTNQTKDCK